MNNGHLKATSQLFRFCHDQLLLGEHVCSAGHPFPQAYPTDTDRGNMRTQVNGCTLCGCLVLPWNRLIDQAESVKESSGAIARHAFHGQVGLTSKQTATCLERVFRRQQNSDQSSQAVGDYCLPNSLCAASSLFLFFPWRATILPFPFLRIGIIEKPSLCPREVLQFVPPELQKEALEIVKSSPEAREMMHAAGLSRLSVGLVVQGSLTEIHVALPFDTCGFFNTKMAP